jgi:hypothetical protein
MRIELQLLRFGIELLLNRCPLFLYRGLVQLEVMRFDILPGIIVVVVVVAVVVVAVVVVA